MYSDELDEYIAHHSTPEDPLLHRLYRHTHLTRMYPRMCSGHVQGTVLTMLTRMIRPQRVLELGTFTGYSALCFAMGMEPGGTVDTIEGNDEYTDDLLAVFREAGHEDTIRLHVGDALEIIPTLEGPFDMVFIDANKRVYPDYYHLVRPLVRPGGYILADNTLWDDKPMEYERTPDRADPQTRGIMDFNAIVAADPTVDKVILPVRDGLTIIRIREAQ